MAREPKRSSSSSARKPNEPARGPFEVRGQAHSARASRGDRSGGSTAWGSPWTSSAAADQDSEHPGEPVEPPSRRYGCRHYDTCLDLAAALNWNSFTCDVCIGEVDPALYWRAHQIQRKDSVARALCDLPPIEVMTVQRPEGAPPPEPVAAQPEAAAPLLPAVLEPANDDPGDLG